jgi:hypothetical protein
MEQYRDTLRAKTDDVSGEGYIAKALRKELVHIELCVCKAAHALAVDHSSAIA